MVPHQTLHLTTEPPGSIVAVWTPAVIQDCCPGMTKMFALKLTLQNVRTCAVVPKMCKLTVKVDYTYLSYDPEIRVCASNGWNFNVWTWKIPIFSNRSMQDQDHSLHWSHSDTQHTLSVCLRRVVAGVPWERSHKITVPSADPLASTFLRMANTWFALSQWDCKKCFNCFWLVKDQDGQNSHLISLFQDKSNTASVCPSTGSAAEAPFKQMQVKKNTIYHHWWSMCLFNVSVWHIKHFFKSRDKFVPFCSSFSFWQPSYSPVRRLALSSPPHPGPTHLSEGSYCPLLQSWLK